jgi:DNA mismatch endonuclease, patch repair protein
MTHRSTTLDNNPTECRHDHRELFLLYSKSQRAERIAKRSICSALSEPWSAKASNVYIGGARRDIRLEMSINRSGLNYHSGLKAYRGVGTGPGNAMDRLTPQRRSWNMSRIRGSNIGPERRVRSLLHRMGFRFSLCRRDLPGRPDIVLPRWRIAVFVHGCFWHQHSGCRNAVMPKTRSEFWSNKLRGNVTCDQIVLHSLQQLGRRVLTVWECELEKTETLGQRLQRRIAGV